MAEVALSEEGPIPLSRIVLVALAFGASALVVILQTLVFQLLPYDSSAIGGVSMALRVGFCLTDATILAALVALRPADPARGLATIGAALATFVVFSGLLGIGASALGADAMTLHALAPVASGAEPIISMGTALLTTLALVVLARPQGGAATSRASVVVIVVCASVALSLAFRLARLVDSGPRSLTLAWASWSIAVARPAVIASFALSLARKSKPPGGADAPGEGPYRAAGEGAPRPAAKPPLDVRTIESLRVAARALSFYRSAFLGRVAAATVTTVLAVIVMGATRSDGAVVAIGIMPVASFATGVLVATSLFRLLALPRDVRARGVTIGAILAIALAALLDAASVLFAAKALFGEYRYRAARDFADIVAAGWPLVALVSGLSLLLAASALGRVGARLDDERVVARAGWVHAFAIASGSAQIAVVFAMASAGGSRSAESGLLVVLGLFVVALGTTITAVVLHALLVGETRAAVLTHAEGDLHAG